jgi:glycine oxidase
MPGGVSSVVVIGGGVIGCASAFALARRGVAVTVLERGDKRVEAPGETGVSTWAAAGIVSAQVATIADGPLARLCARSRALYPDFVARIEALTGLDVQFRPAGVLRPAFDEASLAEIARAVAWQTRAGLRVELLDARAVREAEPALAADIAGAVRFPDDPRVDPPSLLAALRAAIERSGARLRTGAPVRRVIVRGGRAGGVELADGTSIEADAVVVAAGSWSSLIEGSTLPEPSVQPARGQMVELRLPEQLLRGVVEGPDCYLSPRDDGRVLVGSTVERVGFRAGAAAATVRDFLAAAIRLMPALAEATVGPAWSGFRPVAPDELPLLGPTEIDGLFVATAHFRNGVLLSPITGEIIAALITGTEVPADIRPYAPSRLGRSARS